MKGSILSGTATVCIPKLWNPATLAVQPFRRSFNSFSGSHYRSAHNPIPALAFGLRFTPRTTTATTGSFALSECSSNATLWHWNQIRQLPSCCYFGIPKQLHPINMTGRQLRVRKVKETTITEETLLHVHTEARHGIRSTPESSQGEVEKLYKENFGVDSWQFQLLERHEANNLNSYTVAELRQLLRKMNKQPKGQKPDLLKAVKNWLYDRGCPIPSEEEPIKAFEETSLDLGTPEEVANVLKTRAAMSHRIESYHGTKRTTSEPSPETNRKKRKDAGDEEEIDVNNVIAKYDKKSPKVKSAKKATKVETAVDEKEPWASLVHKNPQPKWVAYNPKTMRPEAPVNGEKVMKLLSWNVNGLRALLKEKGLQHEQGSLIARLAAREDFDVLCLQETKLQEKDVEDIKKSLLESHEESLWSCSVSKLGYSGTAIISRIKPLAVHYGLGLPDHDKEGRLITCEFEKFYFIVSYVPNSGAKLERLAYRTQEWDAALSNYMKELEKKKPVILTGDLNCAHEDIDIYDPAGNKKSAGFTDEERASFVSNFLNQGFVDTFRKQHPNAVGYTYWGYRTAARPKNRGWRLDYFLVSESLSQDVHDSYTIPDVGGSDHCPIGLILRTP